MNDAAHTLKVKKDIINQLKKDHFKYHNYINLTEYVLALPDPIHNNNGVAKDVAKKMQESGEFTYEEKGTFPEFWVEKAIRKSWKERNWFLIAVIGYILGLASPLIEKSIEQKISPIPNQSKQTTLILKHSSSS
jgi:hypothetical protein